MSAAPYTLALANLNGQGTTVSSRKHKHSHRRGPEDVYRFLDQAQLAATFDAQAAVRRHIAGISVDDLLKQIGMMPPSARQFVMGTVGARAAKQPSRAAAAQLLARLKSAGPKSQELIDVLAVPALAVFRHPLKRGEWRALSRHDAAGALRVMVRHPDLTVMLDTLVEACTRPIISLSLAAAVAEDTPGALLALGLLAEHDDEAREAYRKLRAEHHPDLPEEPLTLAEFSPMGRLRATHDQAERSPSPTALLIRLQDTLKTLPDPELDDDTDEDVEQDPESDLDEDTAQDTGQDTAPELGHDDEPPHDPGVEPRNEDADEHAAWTALVEDRWDGAYDLATSTAEALAAGQLPEQAAVADLRRFAEEIHALAATLDAEDRQTLRDALEELRRSGNVEPARAWLLRLVALEGPNELALDIASLAALADEAAHEPEHEQDNALHALLTLIDLSTERAQGITVDFSQMVTTQQTASQGLPEHTSVVVAAVAGMLKVPPADDDIAPPSAPASELDPAQGDGADQPAQPDASAPDQVPADDEDDDEDATPSAATDDADNTDDTPQDSFETPIITEQDDDAEPGPTAETAGTHEPPADIEPEPDPAADDNAPTPTAPAADEDGTGEATPPGLDLTALPASLTKYLAPAARPQTPSTESVPAPHVEPTQTTDPQPVDHASHDMTWGETPMTNVDATLVATGRYGLAADIAEATDAPKASVAARRLAAYATYLTNPTGVLAAQFSQHASQVRREELGDDRAGQLAAWAAAAKAAILAPSAGPAEVLAELAPCLQSSEALLELTNALIESSRTGVVIVSPEAVEAAGASSAAKARGRELAERAEDIAVRAKHRTLKYIPANDIYTAWLGPGGALEPILTAVRDNDIAKVNDVRSQVVETLRGRAERHIDSVFRSQQQHKGGRPKVVAQPRQQLVARWDEMVDLAAGWVRVCDEIAAQEAAERSGNWQRAAVSRLRARVNEHREQALDDLAEMYAEAGIHADADSGPRALLEQTFDAWDGKLPSGGEPPVSFVEHGELLSLPLPLSADTLERDDREPITLDELLTLATEPVPAASDTYAALAARAAHDLTAVLISGLRASDPAAAAALDTQRTRDILTTDAEVSAEVSTLRDEIDLRRVAGVLGDDLWARASTQAEALHDQERRDYERIRTAIARITAELDQEREGRIAHVLAQIQANATENPDVAEHQDHLSFLASAGQVASAEEQLQQVLEGAPIVSADNRGKHLRSFFPAVPHALKQHTDALERINQALRTGEHTDATRTLAAAGLDLLALSSARRKQARESVNAWIELASNTPVTKGTSETDKLRIILRQAGIEFRAATREAGNRDRQLLTLTGVDTLGKALTPALGSERSPDQSLRVLLVRRAATPATVIEWMSTQPKDRTVLILWLARIPLSPNDWRAVAEAARGRTANPPAVMIDSASLIYLAAQAEPRLSTLASIALPFTATNPYKDTPATPHRRCSTAAPRSAPRSWTSTGPRSSPAAASSASPPCCATPPAPSTTPRRTTSPSSCRSSGSASATTQSRSGTTCGPSSPRAASAPVPYPTATSPRPRTPRSAPGSLRTPPASCSCCSTRLTTSSTPTRTPTGSTTSSGSASSCSRPAAASRSSSPDCTAPLASSPCRTSPCRTWASRSSSDRCARSTRATC